MLTICSRSGKSSLACKLVMNRVDAASARGRCGGEDRRVSQLPSGHQSHSGSRPIALAIRRISY
jgi:hypothetical protein